MIVKIRKIRTNKNDDTTSSINDEDDGGRVKAPNDLYKLFRSFNDVNYDRNAIDNYFTQRFFMENNDEVNLEINNNSKPYLGDLFKASKLTSVIGNIISKGVGDGVIGKSLSASLMMATRADSNEDGDLDSVTLSEVITGLNDVESVIDYRLAQNTIFDGKVIYDTFASGVQIYENSEFNRAVNLDITVNYTNYKDKNIAQRKYLEDIIFIRSLMDPYDNDGIYNSEVNPLGEEFKNNLSDITENSIDEKLSNIRNLEPTSNFNIKLVDEGIFDDIKSYMDSIEQSFINMFEGNENNYKVSISLINSNHKKIIDKLNEINFDIESIISSDVLLKLNNLKITNDFFEIYFNIIYEIVDDNNINFKRLSFDNKSSFLNDNDGNLRDDIKNIDMNPFVYYINEINENPNQQVRKVSEFYDQKVNKLDDYYYSSYIIPMNKINLISNEYYIRINEKFSFENNYKVTDKSNSLRLYKFIDINNELSSSDFDINSFYNIYLTNVKNNFNDFKIYSNTPFDENNTISYFIDEERFGFLYNEDDTKDIRSKKFINFIYENKLKYPKLLLNSDDEEELIDFYKNLNLEKNKFNNSSTLVNFKFLNEQVNLDDIPIIGNINKFIQLQKLNAPSPVNIELYPMYDVIDGDKGTINSSKPITYFTYYASGLNMKVSNKSFYINDMLIPHEVTYSISFEPAMNNPFEKVAFDGLNIDKKLVPEMNTNLSKFDTIINTGFDIVRDLLDRGGNYNIQKFEDKKFLKTDSKVTDNNPLRPFLHKNIIDSLDKVNNILESLIKDDSDFVIDFYGCRDPSSETEGAPFSNHYILRAIDLRHEKVGETPNTGFTESTDDYIISFDKSVSSGNRLYWNVYYQIETNKLKNTNSKYIEDSVSNVFYKSNYKSLLDNKNIIGEHVDNYGYSYINITKILTESGLNRIPYSKSLKQSEWWHFQNTDGLSGWTFKGIMNDIYKNQSHILKYINSKREWKDNKNY